MIGRSTVVRVDVFITADFVGSSSSSGSKSKISIMLEIKYGSYLFYLIFS
jgi:hypothetical protein